MQIHALQIEQITKKMSKYFWCALLLLRSDTKWNYYHFLTRVLTYQNDLYQEKTGKYAKD